MRAPAAAVAAAAAAAVPWRAAADVAAPRQGYYCDDTHCTLAPYYNGVSIAVWIKDDKGSFDFLDFIKYTTDSGSCPDSHFDYDAAYGTLAIPDVRDNSTCLGKLLQRQFNKTGIAEAVQLWYDGDVLTFQAKPYGACVLKWSQAPCANYPQPPPAPAVLPPKAGYYCSDSTDSAKSCFGDQHARVSVRLVDSSTYDISVAGQTPWQANCTAEAYRYVPINGEIKLDLSDESDCLTKAAKVGGEKLDLNMWWNGATIELATKTVGLCVLKGPKQGGC